MTAVYIVLITAAVIALIIFIPIDAAFSVSYAEKNADVRLTVKYFPIKLSILPAKVKKDAEKAADDAEKGAEAGADPDAAWLHWVAIRRDHQGRGLAKPLISHTLRLMEDYGHRHAYVPTQSTTWLAVRLYLDLGFRPTPLSLERSPTGWAIVRRLTNHPALAAIAPATDDQLLASPEEG